MGHSWVSYAGWVAIIATCVFAWTKGDAAERHGAIWLLGCEIAGNIVLALTFPRPPGIWMLGVDLALAVGLLVLALAHSSLWLGAAMLLQSVALCTHGLVLGGEDLRPLVAFTINNVVSELMLACMAAATIVSWRSRARAARLRAKASPPPGLIQAC